MKTYSPCYHSEFVGCRSKLYSYELYDRDCVKEHEEENRINISQSEKIFWYIQPPAHISVPRPSTLDPHPLPLDTLHNFPGSC